MQIADSDWRREQPEIKARPNGPKGTMFNRYNTISNARMVYLSVPVELNWLTREGSDVNEATATLRVSARGAIVLVRTAPPVGADVRLTNCENKRTIITRTAGCVPPWSLTSSRLRSNSSWRTKRFGAWREPSDILEHIASRATVILKIEKRDAAQAAGR